MSLIVKDIPIIGNFLTSDVRCIRCGKITPLGSICKCFADWDWDFCDVEDNLED